MSPFNRKSSTREKSRASMRGQNKFPKDFQNNRDRINTNFSIEAKLIRVKEAEYVSPRNNGLKQENSQGEIMAPSSKASKDYKTNLSPPNIHHLRIEGDV